MTRRASARVEGVVQGVGFRPYVYRLAHEEGLAGYVLNDERGVLLDVEGAPDAVERFAARLPAEAPPLATIESVAWTPLPPTGEHGFRILESEREGEPDAPVSADAATCPDCLAELLDPADRRYRYPFINCTNCGPRFTIVRGVPYDRPRTTMAGFAMCAACRAEYDDPADRRFHAQPNACPDCGPTVRLGEATGDARPAPGRRGPPRRGDRRRQGHRRLPPGLPRGRRGGRRGPARAQAPRGPALRADGARPRRRRARSSSWGRPRRSCWSGASGRSCSRRGAPAPAWPRPSRPRSAELGVMLPYSPLHHLLAADCAVTLVMTSGNVSDEPIAYRDDDARERLAGIADHVLLHDRPIQTRTDDSVVRAVAGRPLVLRRSRGHVPAALALPLVAPDLLACGAELKSTFCVAKGGRAWVGHHIGDLRNDGDAALLHRGRRALRGALRGGARGRRPRPAPRLPLDDLRAGARGRRARRRPAPPRPPGGRAGRARHDRARDRGDLRRHRLRHRRDGLGRRDPGRRAWTASSRVGRAVARAHARGRPRGAPAVAHGLRVAGGGDRCGAAAAAGRRAAHVACRRRAGAHRVVGAA